MTVVRATIAKSLRPGVKAYPGIYNNIEKIFAKCFKKIGSDKNYEEYVMINNMSNLVEPTNEGGNAKYENPVSQSFIQRLTPSTYKKGFIITEEAQDDGNYLNVFNRSKNSLGMSFNRTQEVDGANVFDRSTNALFLGGDGVSLVNGLHPTENGFQSNTLTTIADLSVVALQELTIAIRKARDSAGNQIGLRPLVLKIPSELIYDAGVAMNSVLLPGTANNDLNVLNKKFGNIEIVDNPYLTTAKSYYFITDCPDGLIYLERRGFNMAEDNDFDTGNLKYKMYIRYVFNWVDWRAVFGTTGTT